MGEAKGAASMGATRVDVDVGRGASLGRGPVGWAAGSVGQRRWMEDWTTCRTDGDDISLYVGRITGEERERNDETS